MNHPMYALRFQNACAALAWTAYLNLLWIAFTLLGGVVFGLGPATVAAYTLARRRDRGELFPTATEFWRIFRQEFIRGSALVLPVVLVGFVLVANLAATEGALWVATFVALVALAGIGSYLVPLYVHYNLPLRAYLPKASLLALTRPAASVLLLSALTIIALATAAAPILAPIISFGAWIQLNTWLCLRFFKENEALLLSKGNP